MAGKKPGFITGANAKVKIGDKVMAYATDVSYSVETLTTPVEVMGRYELLANEPTGYACSGSFNVVRYTSVAKTSGVDDAGTDGNSAGQMGILSHMNPAAMLLSQTFDLVIYQKVSEAVSGAPGSADTTPSSTKVVMTLKDCRVVRRGATLSKRTVLMDQYQFVGIIADDTDTSAGGNGAVGYSGDTDLV